jgi:hypothetical protein
MEEAQRVREERGVMIWLRFGCDMIARAVVRSGIKWTNGKEKYY